MVLEKRLSFEDIKRFADAFDKDPKNILALNAVTENGIAKVALSRKEVDRENFTFSDLIESCDATSQEKSGRCWLFSGLSILSLEAMKNLKVRTFELSEIFQMFWDKLEKANYFLENVIETRREPLDGRVVSSLLADPVPDGGQWNTFVNLIKKYGVMPKPFMPETASSNDSDAMNALLASKLREYAKVLRDMSGGGASETELREKKSELLEEFYRILCISLGAPPANFYWEWWNKEGLFTRGGLITPTKFYDDYVGVKLEDFVSLINAPNKPLNQLYTVQYSGNVVDGQETRYLNVDLTTMKKATVDMITSAKQAVWFGCDVYKMLETDMGAMDLSIYDYEAVFSTKFQLDKAARLDYGDSEITHAMVITGVDLDEKGAPKKWRVENSWGANIGDQGYMYMMDEWFDEYVYEVVVKKELLPTEVTKILDTKPVALPFWDPLCSLSHQRRNASEASRRKRN
jgi:bleomycin hydrolase